MDKKIVGFMKKYYLYIGVGLFAAVSLLLTMDIEKTEIAEFSTIHDTDNQIETYIYIDIRGSILNPGVYKVESGTRLFQLISRAGGLTMDANELVINQSELLVDEMFVYVPSIDEIDGNSVDIVIGNSTISKGKIDINNAAKIELETLPGIGPATAQSIIDYRDEITDFTTIEDIMNVPGIGETTYNEIKDLITT